MARRSSARRRSSRAIIRHASRPIVVRTTKIIKGARHHLRRHGHEAGRMGVILGGALLGFIDKPGGPLSGIPTLPFLGRAGTIGLACWAVGKYGHSRFADQAATGILAIAAYELVKEGHISGVDGIDTGVMGGF